VPGSCLGGQSLPVRAGPGAPVGDIACHVVGDRLDPIVPSSVPVAIDALAGVTRAPRWRRAPRPGPSPLPRVTPRPPLWGLQPRRPPQPAGRLREALVDAALATARTEGPDAVVLRAATRAAAVSPNAACRHFADRDELFCTVRARCLERLADLMKTRQAETALGLDPVASAWQRLRAGGQAYVEFAVTEPGWFAPPLAPSSGSGVNTRRRKSAHHAERHPGQPRRRRRPARRTPARRRIRSMVRRPRRRHPPRQTAPSPPSGPAISASEHGPARPGKPADRERSGPAGRVTPRSPQSPRPPGSARGPGLPELDAAAERTAGAKPVNAADPPPAGVHSHTAAVSASARRMEQLRVAS
jgi:AcrR family transcriptional regulator